MQPMPRLSGWILGVIVLGGLISASHGYIWMRLVRDMQLGQPWQILATGGVVGLALSLPVALILARLPETPVNRLIMGLAFTWLGLFFLILCLMLGLDALRLMGWLTVKGLNVASLWNPEQDPQRRLFLTRLLGSTAMLGALAASAWGVRIALSGPQVVRVRVGLKRFPKTLDGLTVAHISDLHVAPWMGHAYVTTVVERTQALQADLIVITGDLVDGTVEQLWEKVQILKGLSAPHGVFFVTGNHEYYSGVEPWLQALTRLGIRVLRNERVSIGSDGASFDLAGLDDASAHRFGAGQGADIAQALMGRDPHRELILLAHQPKAIFEAAAYDVGLMLCGHTHGGQIWPFRYVVQWVQPYVAGLARHPGSRTQIYVNRGTGYWGPPMRLGAPAEITQLTLACAPD